MFFLHGFSVIPTENGGENMACSDEALVGRIKKGDQAALEELVERWYPKVYAYACRMTGGGQDAQDVTQETFLAVVRSVEGFLPWRAFQSWLFAIAHNKCMDFFRLRGHAVDAPEELEKARAPEIHDRLLDAMVVEQTVARLPPLQREAVVLHYFDGFTPAEIARMTGTPLSTVRWRLNAAKTTLARWLKEEEHG